MTNNERRIAMITGGNSGVGFATASKLAAKGFHVILASRDQQKSTQAIARILASNPGASVESIHLDLASFAAIRQCAAVFQAKGYPPAPPDQPRRRVFSRQASPIHCRRF